MQESKYKAVLFANTLWFIHNFKIPLVEELIKKNFEIEIIYIRLGPPVSNKSKELFKSIRIYTFCDYIFFSLKRILFNKNKSKRVLFSFTIGPILLSVLPLFNSFYKYATLEGLGRVFSSRMIFYRFLKRIIQIVYKIIFLNYYKGIFVLNYSDYAFLLEKKIVQISKLFIIPGTGIDSKIFNPSNLLKYRKEIGIIKNKSSKINFDDFYITYIGRISVDKGFYRFLGAINHLISDPKYSKLLFRIVCPKNDLKSIDNDLKSFLKNNNVLLSEYVSNPLKFYANSKLIVIPTTYGEGLSRVALEAGFLGIPIAALNNRGLSSLFMDGILGETTMDIEPYGISKLIQKINNNYTKYSLLPKKVFNNLVSKYDNKVSADSVVNVVLSHLNIKN